ncbi:site-specific DNA-methyltransferase [Senegalimassilia anaerobia]
MRKIELSTSDGAVENINKLGQLFPQVVTEVQNVDGELERTIDFEALRDLLGDVAEGQRERYQFTWPGKREAKAEARRPICKTMIPEPGKSKDWDTTENLYIEGDNLDALKILKETYAGKVKLIYIDPPYNTGHDFVYDDDFAKTRGEYDAENGEYDEEGGRLVANTEGNGRFHSDWCSMMYPRLLLARDLLTADGSIFISIDDNESANLRKLCDEVFGADRFVGCFAVVNNLKGRNDKANYAPCHESLMVFAKSSFASYGLPLSDDKEEEYDRIDADGNKYQLRDLRKRGNGDRREDRPNMYFPIYCVPSTGACSVEPVTGAIEIVPKLSNGDDGRWRWGFDTVKSNLKLLEPRKKRGGNWGIEYRVYLDPRLNPTSQSDGEERREKPKSVWIGSEFSTDVAQRELKKLFDGDSPFDFPKPIAFLRRIIQMGSANDDLVMDFFSGSAGFAQAVMEQNADDDGRRQFALVQIPEKVSGRFATLANIGEERIRRAGEKVRAEVEESNRQLELGAEPKPYPDLGFRVLRIDSSNFKDFYLTPGETSQESLFDFADNVKEGRSDLDLLFEVLPKLGIPYSAKIEERVLAGKKVFFVDGDKLAACFDANVGSDTIEEMAKAKPWYAVIRDSSMADDATHANYEELFRTYSPDTVPQVI